MSKVATTLEEAQTLIESGFEYVTDMQIGSTTYKLFRKRNLGGLDKSDCI